MSILKLNIKESKNCLNRQDDGKILSFDVIYNNNQYQCQLLCNYTLIKVFLRGEYFGYMRKDPKTNACITSTCGENNDILMAIWSYIIPPCLFM